MKRPSQLEFGVEKSQELRRYGCRQSLRSVE